jgi:hypothetical protein
MDDHRPTHETYGRRRPRRVAPFVLALIVVLGLAVGAQSTETPAGVQVPTLQEFTDALAAQDTRDDGQDARLDALETEPTEEPTEEPTDPPPPDIPTAADFPTRSSVGPAVDPTEAYAGGCYFGADKSGLVIEGKILDCDAAGGVRFAADATGIIIRNSIIRGQMMTTGNTPGDAGADQDGREPVFTVEDSRIVQNSTAEWQDRALCCAHYVVRRSLIEGTHSGLAAHNNVTLVGNFITTDGTDSHSSGMRVLKNTVIRGNTVTCKPVTPGHDGGCSAAGVFYSERLDGTSAAAHHLTIEGNYFRRGVTREHDFDGDGVVDVEAGQPGGPWFATRFINCANRTDCVGLTFTDNLLDLGWGTDGGEFPAAYGGNVWADNYWADGEPAERDTSR